jgi:hypothetical protein
MCQNNIARIYMDTKLYKKAEESFKISVNMAEKEEEQREARD